MATGGRGLPRLTLQQFSSARGRHGGTGSSCPEGLGVEEDPAVTPVIGGKGRALWRPQGKRTPASVPDLGGSSSISVKALRDEQTR